MNQKRLSDAGAEYDLIHWEAVVRTVIDRIGVNQLREIIEYIEAKKADDARALTNLEIGLLHAASDQQTTAP